MIAPGIGAGLDRIKFVGPLVVGHASPGAQKVRIERRFVLISLVHVTAGRVGLPDFDQRVAHGAAVLIEDAAGDDDAFAERLAVASRVARQVAVERLYAL